MPQLGPGPGGGRRTRQQQSAVLPQQVIDDVAALYRLIYENRQALSADVVGKVTGLVYSFAENWDGRLPAPSSIDWRDLVQYPDIDLSPLVEAADFIMALPVTGPNVELGSLTTPRWAAPAIQAGAIDRAMERLRRDAALAAQAAEEQEEEDALMAILMVL